MPLGIEVGLGPGDTVLDRDRTPTPPKQGGTAAPHVLCLVAKRLMDQDATWYGGRPQLGLVVLDGELAPQRGTAPNFWPISVVAKRLDGS